MLSHVRDGTATGSATEPNIRAVPRSALAGRRGVCVSRLEDGDALRSAAWRSSPDGVDHGADVTRRDAYSRSSRAWSPVITSTAYPPAAHQRPP